METVEVPAELFGDAERWLVPEMEVTLRMHGDEPVAVSVPLKQAYKVAARATAYKLSAGRNTSQPHLLGSGACRLPGCVWCVEGAVDGVDGMMMCGRGVLLVPFWVWVLALWPRRDVVKGLQPALDPTPL
eukprot:365991-Chlamydomonas_euryale.AAC.5